MMQSGTTLEHEGVGSIGLRPDVRNFERRRPRGDRFHDRLCLPFTLQRWLLRAVRLCQPKRSQHRYCLLWWTSDDRTLFWATSRKACIPFANVGVMKLPKEVADDEGIMLSGILPTGYRRADIADINSLWLRACRPICHRQRQNPGRWLRPSHR
jgi:hypothetical protein